MKQIITIIISVLVSILIFLGLFYTVLQKPQPSSDHNPTEEATIDIANPYLNWKTIKPGGVIEMKIPAHCQGDGAVGTTYVVCPTDDNPHPTPDMSISSDGFSVNIKRWENLEWSYRDQVLESIRIITPLKGSVNLNIDK
ncbi:hypothetical protein ACFLZY_00880 [Patescibacteria group bacterium]